MITFWKKHRILSVFLIVILVLAVLYVGGLLKEYIQIHRHLDIRYGIRYDTHYDRVKYSIKGVDYHGILPEWIPFGEKDTFYLHDDEHNFDFSVDIGRKNQLDISDNYLTAYWNKRVSMACFYEIPVKWDCKLTALECSMPFTLNRIVSYETAKESSLRDVSAGLRELWSADGSYFLRQIGVEASDSSVSFCAELSGNDNDAKETAFAIYDYMMHTFRNVTVDDLKINNRTVMSGQTFQTTKGNEQFLSQEEFIGLLS